MNPNNLVCRTCLGIISEGKVAHNIDEENGLIRNVRNIREMIIFCVPEMDIYVSVSPVVCETCLGIIVNVYNFKIRCLRVENAIRSYIQTNSVMEGSVVNLNNVVKQQIIEALRQKNWSPAQIKEYMDNYLCPINKQAQTRRNYCLPLNEPMFQAMSQSLSAPHKPSYVSGQRSSVPNVTMSNVHPSTAINNCPPPSYVEAVHGSNFVPAVPQIATQGPPLQPPGVLFQQQIPSHQIQNHPPQIHGIQPQAAQTTPEAPQTAPQGRGYITVSKNLMPARPDVSFLTPQIQTISRFNTPPFSKQPIVLNSYVAQNPDTSAPPFSNLEEFQSAFLQQLQLTSTTNVQGRQEAVYMKKKEPKKRTSRAKKNNSQVGIQNNMPLERDVPGLNFTNQSESSENSVIQTSGILNPVTGLMEESVPRQSAIQKTGLRSVRRSTTSKVAGDNNGEGASESDDVIILDDDTDVVPDGMGDSEVLLMNFHENINVGDWTNVSSQGTPNLTSKNLSDSVNKTPEKKIFVKLPKLDKDTLKRKLTDDDIIDEILLKRRKLVVKLNPSLPYLNKKKRLIVNVRREQFFICMFCKTTTLCEKKLWKHYLSSHKVCLRCNFRCDRAAVLTQHINSRHKLDLQEALKIFDHPKSELHCYLCNFIGLSDLDLRDHRLRIHVKCDTTGMYKCPYITCDEENPIAYEIAIHIEKKHDRSRQTQCPLCNYHAPIPSAVKRHLESHSLTKLKCNFCTFWSKTTFNLNIHIKRKHPESERKNSTVSGMVFTDDLQENDDQTSCSYSDDYRITLDTFKERTQESQKNAPVNTPNSDGNDRPNLDQYEFALPSLSEMLCAQLFTEDLSDQENDCTIVSENYSEPPVSEHPSAQPVSECPSELPVSECPSELPVSECPSEPPVSEHPSEPPISEDSLMQTVSEYRPHKFKKPRARPKSKQIANQESSMLSKGHWASKSFRTYGTKKSKKSLENSSVDDSEDCMIVNQDITTVDLSDDDDPTQDVRRKRAKGIQESETNTSEVIEIEDQDDNDDCFVISDDLAIALGSSARSFSENVSDTTASENVSDTTASKLPDDSETDTCSEMSSSAQEQSLRGDVSASETETCSEVSVSDVLSSDVLSEKISSKDTSGKADENNEKTSNNEEESQKSDSQHAKDKSTRDDIEPELTSKGQNEEETNISSNETLCSEKEVNGASKELSSGSGNINQNLSDAQTEPSSEDKNAFETNENQESPEKFDQDKRSSDKDLTNLIELNKNLEELLDEPLLDISRVSENRQESQETSSASSVTDLESMTIELSDQESNDCTFVSETNAQEETDGGTAASEIVNEESDNSKRVENEKDVSELLETNSNEVVPEECRDKLENMGESSKTTEKTEIIDIDCDDRGVSDTEKTIVSSELIADAEEDMVLTENNAQEETDGGNAPPEIVNEESDKEERIVVNEKDVSELSETNSNEVVPEECQDKLENMGESSETTEKNQTIDIDCDDRVVSDKEKNIVSSELIIDEEEDMVVIETDAQEETNGGNAPSEIINEENSKRIVVNEKDVSEVSETNSNEVAPEKCRDKLENMVESSETTEKTQIIDIDCEDRVVTDERKNIDSSELIIDSEEDMVITDSEPKDSENLQKNTEVEGKEGESSKGDSEIIELEEEISNTLNADSEMTDVQSTGVTRKALDHVLEAKDVDRSDTTSAQKQSNNQAEDTNSGTLTVNLESESDKAVITQKSGLEVDSDTVESAQNNAINIQGSSSGKDACGVLSTNISTNLDCSESTENANNLSHGSESNQKVVERKSESVEFKEPNSENVDAKVAESTNTISDDPPSVKEILDSKSEKGAESVEVNEHNSENVDSTDAEMSEEFSETVSNQSCTDVEEKEKKEKCSQNSNDLELLQNSKISTRDSQKGDISENVDRVAECENSESAINIDLVSETNKD